MTVFKYFIYLFGITYGEAENVVCFVALLLLWSTLLAEENLRTPFVYYLQQERARLDVPIITVN
jgi:hypothetical protein